MNKARESYNILDCREFSCGPKPHLQLTPAPMDCKGLTFLSVKDRFLLLPIYIIKKYFLRDQRITSVIGGLSLLAGLL